MRFIRSLSGITLVSCLSVSSGAAMANVTEQVASPISSRQTESMMMAGLFDRIQDGVRTIREVDQAVDSVTSIIEQENHRQELEAARKAATEQERLEAERRQRYFESLSPEEQQAYIQEQQAMQARRDQAAAIFLLGVGAMMFGGASSEPAPAESSYEYYPPNCRYEYIEGEHVRICP